MENDWGLNQDRGYQDCLVLEPEHRVLPVCADARHCVEKAGLVAVGACLEAERQLTVADLGYRSFAEASLRWKELNEEYCARTQEKRDWWCEMGCG